MNKADIFRLYPRVLRNDVQFAALGEVVSEQLAENRRLADKSIIYAAIEMLPEEVLDALAYDFKVDWYEYSAPIENKRKAIKECLLVHKYKGTKYAVETALHSVFNNAEIEEWFEYGGEPYHFKLTVFGGTGSGSLKNLYSKIQYAKNLRSVMDDILFLIIPESPLEINVGIKCSAVHKRIVTALQSHDDSIFNVPVSAEIGSEICGYSKRINTELHSNDDSVFNISASAKCGAASGSVYKRICAELIYKDGGTDNVG